MHAPTAPNRVPLLNALLCSLRKDGHRSLHAVWRAQGQVVYEAGQGARGRIVQIQPNGTRRMGHLVDRTFVPDA